MLSYVQADDSSMQDTTADIQTIQHIKKEELLKGQFKCTFKNGQLTKVVKSKIIIF